MLIIMSSKVAGDDVHGVEYELFQVPAILLVTVVSAIDLPPLVDSCTCNPMVKIQYHENKFFTSQKTKTTKPIWNETFTCIYKKELFGKLTFTVYDSNPFGRNTVIGDIEISLDGNFRKAEWFKIAERRAWSMLDIGRQIVTERKYGSLGQLFLAINILNMNQEPVYVNPSPNAPVDVLDPNLVDVTCFPEVALSDGETYNSRRDSIIDKHIGDEEGEYDENTVQECSQLPMFAEDGLMVQETDVVDTLNQLYVIINTTLIELEYVNTNDEYQSYPCVADDGCPPSERNVDFHSWLADRRPSRRQSAFLLPMSALSQKDVVDEASSDIKLPENDNERYWVLLCGKMENNRGDINALSSSSVKVAVRIRPTESAFEKTTSIIRTSLGTDIICENKRTQIAHQYAFDYCFNSEAEDGYNDNSQSRIFELLGIDILYHSWEGFNTCLFAYGQTGSGKSYSMLGTQSDPGVIPRICSSLFYFIENHAVDRKITVDVSFLEIYNERIYDLLDNSRSDLKLREHPKSGVFVENLSKFRVFSFAEISLFLSIGMKERITASTGMNDKSSRSHAVFTMTLNCAFTDPNCPLPSRTSKISLVDLAGSERSSSTDATGVRLREGANINKSLSTLGRCISALSQISSAISSKKVGNLMPKIRIPFRDSVLTLLLRDCLSGNSKTTMLATVSPAHRNYSETLSTLRYAANASKIKTSPVINDDPTAKLIAELRAEIARLGAELNASKVSSSSSIAPPPPSKFTNGIEDAVVDALNAESSAPSTNKSVLRSFTFPDCINISEQQDVAIITTMSFSNQRFKLQLPRCKELYFGQLDGKTDGDFEADVLLLGQEIKPLHAKITHDLKGRLVLFKLDLNSSVTVNGVVEVHEDHEIRVGDYFTLGKFYTFVLCVPNYLNISSNASD